MDEIFEVEFDETYIAELIIEPLTITQNEYYEVSGTTEETNIPIEREEEV